MNNYSKYLEMVKYEKLTTEAYALGKNLISKYYTPNSQVNIKPILIKAMLRWDRRMTKFQKLVREYYGGGK